MNQDDLIFAFDWIVYVSNAHKRNMDQRVIDKLAMERFERSKCRLSRTCCDIMEDAVTEMFDCPGAGNPEKIMLAACQTVIQQAEPGAYDSFIKGDMDPQPKWEEIWKEFRKTN